LWIRNAAGLLPFFPDSRFDGIRIFADNFPFHWHSPFHWNDGPAVYGNVDRNNLSCNRTGCTSCGRVARVTSGHHTGYADDARFAANIRKSASRLCSGGCCGECLQRTASSGEWGHRDSVWGWQLRLRTGCNLAPDRDEANRYGQPG
jgi:hypothetical protein